MGRARIDGSQGLGTALACLAIAGLVAWLWSAEGRLLLVMFFGSLVPFSMTWTVLGGAEWRLTFFAYAFYLIAAFWVVDRTVRVVRSALRSSDPKTWAQNRRRQIFRPRRLCSRSCWSPWPGGLLCRTPSPGRSCITQAPPTSLRDLAIDGSLPTAGPPRRRGQCHIAVGRTAWREPQNSAAGSRVRTP